MKKVLLVCLLLTGCGWFDEMDRAQHERWVQDRTNRIAKIQEQLNESQYMKGCVVESIGDYFLFRCPNSKTTVDESCGKNCTNHLIVED